MRVSMQEWPDLKAKTQVEKIHWYILKYGSITTKQAMEDLGCFRLASRIHDMKNLGIPIHKESVNVPTRWGTVTQVAKYSIDPMFVYREELRMFDKMQRHST